MNLNELSRMVKNIGDEAITVIDKSWVFMSFCLDCVFLNIGLVLMPILQQWLFFQRHFHQEEWVIFGSAAKYLNDSLKFGFLANSKIYEPPLARAVRSTQNCANAVFSNRHR